MRKRGNLLPSMNVMDFTEKRTCGSPGIGTASAFALKVRHGEATTMGTVHPGLSPTALHVQWRRLVAYLP